MRMWSRVRSWLRAVMRRSRMESEMDVELRFHIEAFAEDLVRRGVSREEALRRARIEFGGVERAKEECREARGVSFVENMIQDLRVGSRTLRKNPGFTTIAVLTLALGIGVNAAMFSLVSAFLLRRPPGHEPERVAVVSSVSPAPGFHTDALPVSAPNYLAWRQANNVFVDVAAADEGRTANLTAQGQPEAVHSAAVSLNYFTVLGVAPELGRAFATGEDQPGRDHVFVLSHNLWERRFGSDPSIVGSTVRLNREIYTVIGVMPASFRLMGYTPQIWIPLVLNASDQSAAARRDRSLHVFARLKPRVAIEQARAEFATLGHRAEENFPETEKGWGTAVRTLPEFLVYDFGVASGLAVMMTTVGFVLMIACANVAGLLLARAAGRRKELAIRLSLGASRVRIIAQLLIEGLMIAFLGGVGGLLLANWCVHFVRTSMAFSEVFSAVPLSLDRNVFLFVLSVSLLSALLSGLVPAVTASRTDINNSLKDENRGASAGRSHTRLRAVLVTAEIGMALLLLVGTGLLMRGISAIEHQNLGFRVDRLLTAGVVLDNARYKNATEQMNFIRDLIARLQQIPGAEAAAVASDLPATGPGSVTLRIKGQPELPANQQLSALHVVVSVDYLRAAGIPLLHGRAFTETDNGGAPRVALVNQEFARRYLPDQNALGKQILLDVNGATPEWSEIVGIVSNIKTYSEEVRDDPEVYECFLQRPVSSFSLMLRTSSDPNGAASALREAVAQADAELPLANVMSMSTLIDHQKGGNPFFVRLLGSFAILALILAAIGIYGLLAYSVSRRAHEIGIRMALGAKSSDVLGMVLREGMKMTGIGMTIGFVLALPLPKLFEAIFYGLHFGEFHVYWIVPLGLLLVAMLASYIPARRAMRVDPMVALRYE